MSGLESSYLAVFSGSSHLTVLTKSIQNTKNNTDFNGLKELYRLYSQKKCHSLPGISEKVHTAVKFQKFEFVKYATTPWTPDVN